jgi:heterodisulfide reductase subunit B
MIGLLEALGVTIHRHPYEASCCGTSLVMTKPEVGIQMAGTVLQACSPADCIVTVCPMCHMNLDSYQDKASRAMGESLSIPILFLPQLIGLAFGLPESAMMFHRHVVPVQQALESLSRVETA